MLIMSFNDMPRFEKDWYFLGYVERSDYPELSELLAKYKCTMKDGARIKESVLTLTGSTRYSVYVNNPFRIDSIRKRLWGHRWAINKGWLDENPELKDFDPRKVKKIKKRLDK